MRPYNNTSCILIFLLLSNRISSSTCLLQSFHYLPLPPKIPRFHPRHSPPPPTPFHRCQTKTTNISAPSYASLTLTPSNGDTKPTPTTATTTTTTTTKENHTATALEKWLISKGGKSDRVTITSTKKDDPNEIRGLIATRDAMEGDVLLTVPLEACLSTFHNDNNDGGGDGSAPAWSASLPRKVQLAIRVIEEWNRSNERIENGDTERFPSSSWASFLDSWPNEVHGLPENMSDHELELEAQCDTLVADARQYRKWLEEQYRASLDLSQRQSPSHSFCFCGEEMFRRAVQLVGSRSIRLSASRSVLVPILDMANHSNLPSARYRLVEEDDSKGKAQHADFKPSIQLLATRALCAGDEVSISYGDYCNRQMAGCYGFVPISNPYDYELISLLEILQAAIDGGALIAPPDDGRFLFSLVDRVAAFGVPTTNLRLLPTELDGNLWLALRFAMLTWDDDDDNDGTHNDIHNLADILEAIEMDEADEFDLWDSDTNIDAVKRATVLHAALVILERRIGGGPTSVEEDECILRDYPHRTRILVELRLERKRLIRSVSRQMEIVMAEPDGALSILANLIQYSSLF